MALENVSNQATSKAAAKKNKKKDVSPTDETAITVPDEAPANDTATMKTGTPDPSNESPYIKELQKTIRNVTKKLASMQKVDSVIAENPDVSLDELVASRKINNDQKAQALKKPALQAQLVQLEEQIAQYKKFEEEHQAQTAKERQQLETAHTQELENLRITAKAEATSEAGQVTRQNLLTLSKFLRAAAARRQLEDDLSDESKAFEGLLLLLYGGDGNAVDAAEKLITGSDQGVPSTDDQILGVSYSKIKELSEAYAPFAAEEAWRQEVAEAEQTDLADTPAEHSVPKSDPTIAHAGLTELNEAAASATTVAQPHLTNAEPGNVDTGAANVAASSWDANASSETQDPMGGSWTYISRDTLETEVPAADVIPTNDTPSWADDAHETPVAPAGDGFHEVHHARNSGRSRGSDRGGRGRGSFRGDGMGHRGRGGFRGDRGGEFRGRGRGGGGGGPSSRGASRGAA